MTLSEALQAVRSLIQSYPNGGANAGDGYIGALAAVLGQYPRQVAMRCANPLKGVSRETKFLPTVADLIAWLERETEPLRRQVDRDIRVARQIEETEAWRSQVPSDRLKELGRSWLDRSDPVAAALVGEVAAERAHRQSAATVQIERANETLRGREAVKS